nr:type IV toxin-antitoxin system AbiEi family antitoxin domain-containing protein [Mobiluncus mulieris]
MIKYVTISNMNKEYYRGIFSTAMLREHQVSRRRQEKLVSEGKLRQIRHGWYATNDAHQDAIRAIKHGGQVGCISGCKVHGLWIPPKHQKQLHICVSNQGGAKLDLDRVGISVHRGGDREISSIRFVQDCLTDVMKHHDPETALVILESAVNHKLVTFNEGEALIAGLPENKRWPLRHFARGAQSGSETRVRLFFNQRNVKVKPQEHLRNIGWVDLLVGKSLIVECDSQTYHSSGADTHKDRVRDEYADKQGYTVIRLSYPQIWYQWEETQDYLERKIKTHRYRYLLKSF